jgi:hypothetical protein
MALNLNLPGVRQAVVQQLRPITYQSIDTNAIKLTPQIQRAAADAVSKGYNLADLNQYFQDEEDRKALETAERLAKGSEALEESIAQGLIPQEEIKSVEDIMAERIEDVNAARIAEAEDEAQQALIAGERAQLMQGELAAQEETKSNLWLGLTVAGLVAVGGVTWYYMNSQKSTRR